MDSTAAPERRLGERPSAAAPAAEPMPPARWLVVSNFALPSLAEHGRVDELGGGLFLLRRDAGEVEAPCAFDLDAMAPAAATAADGGATIVELRPGGVAVRTSVMSAAPTYFVDERRSGRFALFNDLFLAPPILRALGLPVALRRDPVAGESETVLRHVSRLGPEALFEAEARDGGWSIGLRRQPDRLGRSDGEPPPDADAAGVMVIEALVEVVAELAAAAPGRRVACMLSGGIDSATVAWAAHEAGLPPRLFSVATPWGDELAEAGVTAEFLCTRLEPVRFSEEELVAAIADTVRWSGAFDADLVDGLLAPVAFVKHGRAPECLLLTGYGNDLLNGGLCDPGEAPESAEARILELVDRARNSNEFSPAQAHAYGREVAHPYWDLRTIRASLAVPARHKVFDGQAKRHFRQAMSAVLPAEVAWRPKLAMHHGNLLAEGLAGRIERDVGAVSRKPEVYRAIFAVLTERAAAQPLAGVDGGEVYERALALAGKRPE